MCPLENILYFPWIVSTVRDAADSISGVIKWCWTAGRGRRHLLCIFILKSVCKQKFHSWADKEMWIELNQIGVSNNGKWSFFPPLSNYYGSILCAFIFQRGITDQLPPQCFVHLISAHWLIPLSPTVAVGLERSWLALKETHCIFTPRLQQRPAHHPIILVHDAVWSQFGLHTALGSAPLWDKLLDANHSAITCASALFQLLQQGWISLLCSYKKETPDSLQQGF